MAQKNRVRLIYIVVTVLFLSAWMPYMTAYGMLAHSPSYQVLFISSYHAGFDTLPDQVKGLQSVFDAENVKLDIDYMDTKRINTEEQYANYYSFLKYRLDQGLKYDVVLVGDDNGLQFLMDHQNDLLKGTPLVFFCINDMERAEKANQLEGVTGIVEGISLKDNLDLATKLFPKAKKIYGIVDDTPTGAGDATSFMLGSSDYPQVDFELLNASQFDEASFTERLSQIEATDIVFYLSYFEDKTGKTYTIDESTEIISEHVEAPVFRMSIGGVGHGLLGGIMVSYEEQGRQAALMAMSIIEGHSPESIQMIDKSPNKAIFDYNMMKTYGIKKSQLPKNAILLNEPVNYFELYKDIIIPAGIIVLVLSSFFVILFVDYLKLKAKDKQLYENNLELSALYEEMAASEEELRNKYDQLIESKVALHESEERYRVLALTDALTGLKNRNALIQFLDVYVKHDMKKWYLVYIDLDNFKYINDSRGHEIGDDILKEVGERIESFTSECTFVSRIGGDEFVLIIEAGPEKVENIVKRVMSKIEDVIYSKNLLFYLTCSVGIANFPNDGMDKNVLLRRADMAMYQAKFAGRSRYMYYVSSMEESFSNKLNIHNQIRFALENQQFSLMYQPQFDLNKGELIGTEALIRWKDTSGQFISPAIFIPIAEEQGIIRMIGKWVYEEAFKMAKQCNTSHRKAFSISVNVSSVELIDENFAEEFIHLIHKHQFEPSMVAVEITESILIVAKEKAVQQLTTLRKEGIQIHLDDFGAGYSSLNYLITLPLDVVKIDRQFIGDMIIDKRYEDMVKFIIEISHGYGLKVVAEGVETKEQFEKLAQMKCDIVQGYFYAKPLDYDQLNTFIKNN